MALSPQILAAAFSLGGVFCWGTSDFLGGYASRRANAFLVTTIAHGSGLVLMASLAFTTHATPLSGHSAAWAFAAGTSGGLGLALFYRALSKGNMGLAAPVAALLGAAIPTVVGILTEGWPEATHLLGFVLAGVGIWLISRSGNGAGTAGIGLAAISGIGFAGFYLGMKAAGEGSALWMATLTRTGALAITASVVLFQRRFHEIVRSSAFWGAIAGCLDTTGTACFVRASQMGRLDSAVVLTSLYPAVTVLLARWILHEHFTRWKTVGMIAALVAVPLIAAN